MPARGYQIPLVCTDLPRKYLRTYKHVVFSSTWLGTNNGDEKSRRRNMRRRKVARRNVAATKSHGDEMCGDEKSHDETSATKSRATKSARRNVVLPGRTYRESSNKPPPVAPTSRGQRPEVGQWGIGGLQYSRIYGKLSHTRFMKVVCAKLCSVRTHFRSRKRRTNGRKNRQPRKRN